MLHNPNVQQALVMGASTLLGLAAGHGVGEGMRSQSELRRVAAGCELQLGAVATQTVMLDGDCSRLYKDLRSFKAKKELFRTVAQDGSRTYQYPARDGFAEAADTFLDEQANRYHASTVTDLMLLGGVGGMAAGAGVAAAIRGLQGVGRRPVCLTEPQSRPMTPAQLKSEPLGFEAGVAATSSRSLIASNRH